MFFTCEYCSSKFLSEKIFEKHFCEEKKKRLLLKTKIGRSAFYHYQIWRKLLGFKANDEKAFCNSKYFKPFVNFISFADEKLLPDKTGYIELMIAMEVLPAFWMMDEYYDHYVQKFDILYSPMKQLDMSIDYLFDLAKVMECKISEVFENLGSIELINLIISRKLSPWLLLFMPSFNDFIKYEKDKEMQILFSTHVNTILWNKKFDKYRDSTLKIKEIVKMLDLR